MTEPGAPDPIDPFKTGPVESRLTETGAPERVRVEGPPPRKRFDALPLLYLLGFLVLAGSLFYLYRNPSTPPGVEQAAARVDTLQEQIQSLTDRLAQVEQRPAPAPPPSLAPLEARITTLERRPAPVAPAAQDLGPITARLDSASEKQSADIQGLTARLDDALAKQGSELAKQSNDMKGLTTRLDDALAKQSSELAKQSNDMKGLTARLDTLEGRLATVEKQDSGISGQIAGITERAQRISRIQAASAALEAGQKLGDIPGAPPALAQFAHDAPPTEAGLRLSFNSAAEAAQRASQPAIMDDQPFASRLWTRAQQAVTVRQGDRVLLGDPVSGVLAHARQALDAGDLAGAITALNGLAGPAAAAMSGWVGQARALLEARAALATMAARG
jgi:hypothetical protein